MEKKDEGNMPEVNDNENCGFFIEGAQGIKSVKQLIRTHIVTYTV